MLGNSLWSKGLGIDFNVEVAWSGRIGDGFQEAGGTGDVFCGETVSFGGRIEGLRHS